MNNSQFDFDAEDSFMDDMFARADTWEDQIEFIGSLMDMEDQLDIQPVNWEELVQEPEPEEMAEMDANAEELLMSLQ